MVAPPLTRPARAQAGDAEALNALIARFLPRLQRWATGRLPGWARDMADNHDLVQETVVQAFKKIEKFEDRGEGALQAYLRQVLLNRIRQEILRAGRGPGTGTVEGSAGRRARQAFSERGAHGRRTGAVPPCQGNKHAVPACPRMTDVPRD